VKPIFAGVLCLMLGLGIGHLRAASTAPAPVTRIEPAPVRTPRAEIREVVRREIVRSEPAVPVAEPVVDERIDRARVVVERAKTRGVWTDRDRDTLRDEMDGLDGSTKAEIVAAFSDAVNRGELRIEAEVPL